MIELYDALHELLVQQLVLPVMYSFDLMGFADDADIILDRVLLGILQLVIIALILRPLEKNETQFVHEQDFAKDAQVAKRVDIFYSMFHRLGLFQLVFYILFAQMFFYFGAQLHDAKFLRLNVENWLPGITSIPLVSFFIYLIIFDFVDYCYHRLSHRFDFWWQLHALHHSQRHMTAWSDNRNHLLDDIVRALVFTTVGLFLGVEPSQFLFVVVTSRLIQSWQHGFYPYRYGILKYLIVTPHFHRYHHAIQLGYEIPGKPGVLGGCNFGVLFPWWDMLLGTAQFDENYHPSGVKDYQPPHHFFQQQLFALQKCWATITAKDRR
jgi:sterol desaturase/sphingolipid hydroxylase (fatty acid hydroxylase superfamily)